MVDIGLIIFDRWNITCVFSHVESLFSRPYRFFFLVPPFRMALNKEQSLYDKWFDVADVRRQGKLTGGDAVTFFNRSKLEKTVLREIWDLVAGNSGELTKRQFTSCMSLISHAQSQGGKVDPVRARSILSGLSIPPPPFMEGLPGKSSVFFPFTLRRHIKAFVYVCAFVNVRQASPLFTQDQDRLNKFRRHQRHLPPG